MVRSESAHATDPHEEGADVSVIIDIAEKVAAALEAATLPQSVTVTRAYSPKTKRDQAADAEAIVIPRSRSSEASDRHRKQIIYGVDVGVRKRGVKPEEVEEIDDLMDLVQAITNLFEQKRLEGYPAARCTAVTSDPIFDPVLLADQTVFMAPVSLQFLVWEDV